MGEVEQDRVSQLTTLQFQVADCCGAKRTVYRKDILKYIHCHSLYCSLVSCSILLLSIGKSVPQLM